MGLKLRYAVREGPAIDNPVRTSDDVDALSTANTDDLGYVGQAIQQVVRALAGKVPVIGFVGAPFTMASYMIEGGGTRNFGRTKRLMYRDETLWRRLMGKIVDVLAPFGRPQATAGARAIQVFDSWVGALGSDDYVRYAAPYSRALIERIRATGIPVIHFGTGASGFFRELHAAGGDVMGVDWRINIDQAWMDISYRSAIQGNLDPVALFAPLPELRAKVHELLKRCSQSHTVSTATLSFNRNKVLESPDATVTTAQLTILTATQERRQVMLQITGSGAKRNLMQVVSDKQ